MAARSRRSCARRCSRRFEKAQGVTIAFVAGNSTDTLAKLQAQKDHPDLDIVIMDDGPMQRAMQLGFCAKINPGPNYKNVYDLARMGDTAVATGVVATGIGYNADAFAKAGWQPPTSWGGSGGPEISRQAGHARHRQYVRAAGADHVCPHERRRHQQDRPRLRLHEGQDRARTWRAFESSPGRMSELFQSGEIVAAVWGSSRVAAVAATGFPLKFVFPEGRRAGLVHHRLRGEGRP
ncbi:MAG: extracellular solute-binding protein [Acetobacteraceae bacterium]